MNADQVVDKILSEARQEAQKILDEARAKVEATQEEMRRKLADFEKETEAMAAAAAEDKRQRMLAAARMQSARDMLKAKTDLLDEVFRQVEDRIVQLPAEQYITLMVRLMTKAVETGDEDVIIGTKETRITADVIKQVNRQLGDGGKGNLRLSDTRADIKGGFILSRGKVQVNASVEVLVAQLREATELEIAEKLFS
jgi:V/A-type H+-transporting ATPase subunit E